MKPADNSIRLSPVWVAIILTFVATCGSTLWAVGRMAYASKEEFIRLDANVASIAKDVSKILKKVDPDNQDTNHSNQARRRP